VEPGTRRLAAILIADVVGYSRMMAADEDGTLSALRAHRTAIDPIVLNHGGRIVKSTGDGVLVEFPSAREAVSGAVEIQDLMRIRADELPASRRMQLRIGINLGDVVVDETGDVYGDGVNVAARLEGIAPPGGIAISDAVYAAVRGSAGATFVDRGHHELKNIPEPVRVWMLGTPAETTQPDAARRRTIATVAVLPFDNMSGDPDQAYFADGITEDLLTAVSYDADLAVVARNSTFAYKGRATDIRTIARELDATHIVEGSVRKSGTRVRVTAQLIDAETGHHVWAERFDRELVDIFDLQDELVESITVRLRPAFWDAAGRRRATGDARSFDAWDLTIRGQFHLNTHTLDGFEKSIEFFERARAIEPDLVAAIAGSAGAWLLLAISGWRREGVNPWERGLVDAETAYRLAPDDYAALGSIAAATNVTGEPERGIAITRRMIELNPHASFGYHMLGANLNVAGRQEEAVSALTDAWRLGRHEPIRYDIANDLAYSHYMLHNYDAAVTWGQQAIRLHPRYLQSHLALAAALAQLNRLDEAHRHVAAVMRAQPDFSCARYRGRILYLNDDDRDHIVDGLHKAGLPD
jgi:adenylate cyclase